MSTSHGTVGSQNYVWDINTLAWVAMEQPILNAGSVTVSGSVSVSNFPATQAVSFTTTALTASSPTSATVGVASAEAVPVNANRRGLVLVNVSANRVSLGFGVPAVLDTGITLMPNGGTFVMDALTFTTAQVRAIASAGSSPLAIQEFTA